MDSASLAQTYFQLLDIKTDFARLRPWGKATSKEVYTYPNDNGTLEELKNQVRQTVQHRIQRLELAGHLKNARDVGVYRFVDDPREDSR